MKNLKITIVLFFACFTSYAQNPQLLNNDWYLQKVIIDDIDNFSPIANLIGRIAFTADDVIVFHPFCEESYGGIIQEYIGETSFTLEDGPVVLIGNCTEPSYDAFMELHYSIYYTVNDGNNFAKNPLLYSLATESGVLYLTILNPEGDSSIYSSVLLSTQDLTASKYSIHPNPTATSLTIKTADASPFSTLEIYDVSGKRVLVASEAALAAKTISVETLQNGIYFLKLENVTGKRSVLKFVKQ